MRNPKRIAALVVTATIIAAACAGSDDDEAIERTAATVDSSTLAVSTSLPAGEPEGTTAASPATSPPTTIAIAEVGASAATPTELPIEEEGLIVTNPIVTSGAPGAVVAVGPTFLMITPEADRSTVSQSDDGLTWTPVEADLPLPFLASVASDGARVVAVGANGDDDYEVWESTDGGTTWAPLPTLPIVEPDGEYLTQDPGFTGVAVAGDRVVILATEPLMVDWRAYSIGELGEDHGFVNSMSDSAEGTVVVDFEDGFQLTVEASSLGLEPDELFGSAGDVVAYSYDGSVWTRTELPWMNGSRGNVVHGPAGFAALLSQGPSEFVVSTDGIAWEAASMPAGFEFEPSLAGGPLGYVVANETSMAFSVDGVEWDTVNEFDNLDPNIIGTKLDAGGAGGFAFVDVPFQPGSRGRVHWSSDGRSWDAVMLDLALQQPTIAAAVDDSSVLVVPFDLVFRPPVPAVEGDLSAVVAASFVDPPEDPSGLATFWPPVTEEEGACIADGLLDRLGEDRVRESGLGAFPFHLLSVGLMSGFDADEAATFVDVISGCTPSWEQFLILGITSGTHLISEETALCIQETFDDDDARDLFALELTPHPNADPGHLSGIESAFDQCATEQELSALDWN